MWLIERRWVQVCDRMLNPEYKSTIPTSSPSTSCIYHQRGIIWRGCGPQDTGPFQEQLHCQTKWTAQFCTFTSRQRSCCFWCQVIKFPWSPRQADNWLMNGLISRHKVPLGSKASFSTTKCGGKQLLNILQTLIVDTVCALTRQNFQTLFSHISPTSQWKTLQICQIMPVLKYQSTLTGLSLTANTNFQASVAAPPSAPSCWRVHWH